MYYLNSKENKSGHPKTRTPIMLCFKARGIHPAPPGSSYDLFNEPEYLNFMLLINGGVA